MTFDLLGELQSVLNRIVSEGPLIDSLDAEGWGPADPDGVRLVHAIYEASGAVDAWLAARPGILDDQPAASVEPGLRARLDAVIAEHTDEGGYARFGGDALLGDLRAALAASVEPGSVAAVMPDEAEANSAAWHASIERAQAERGSVEPETDPALPVDGVSVARQSPLDRLNDTSLYDARRREVADMIYEADAQDDHPMGPDGLADALMEIALGWLRAALSAETDARRIDAPGIPTPEPTPQEVAGTATAAITPASIRALARTARSTRRGPYWRLVGGTSPPEPET